MSVRTGAAVSTRDETCRIFRNDLLEAGSHVHPATPVVLYVPVVLLALGLGLRAGLPAPGVAVAFLGGAVLWTLAEYLLHRFVFHAPPRVERETRAIVAEAGTDRPIVAALPTWRHRFWFLAHGVHHDFPNDRTRLVMPPMVSVPLAVLFYALFRAVAADWGLPVFAGFVAGYVAYDVIHYRTHHGGLPTAAGRRLRKHHLRHHHHDPERNYGVSNRFWDRAFRTLDA